MKKLIPYLTTGAIAIVAVITSTLSDSKSE